MLLEFNTKPASRYASSAQFAAPQALAMARDCVDGIAEWLTKEVAGR
eukprot:SAG22_NODE_10214_length_547_cov_1.236607_2_plen_47_part_00